MGGVEVKGVDRLRGKEETIEETKREQSKSLKGLAEGDLCFVS